MIEDICSLQVVKMKDLKPYAKNPRKISKEQYKKLSELIEKFGLIEKPIINKDLTIIGGHQRIKILKKMKWKEVPCWVAKEQLTEEAVEHLCVGLNLNQGSFDYDILANEFEALDLLNWGFTEAQLLGSYDIEEESEEKESKGKKKKVCPNCNHEF